MRLFGKLCVLLCLLGTQGWADRAAYVECLNKMLPIQMIGTKQQMDEDDIMKLRVTNNLSEAIGGLYIEYEIYTAERPSALASSTIDKAWKFPGGLLPGESIDLEQRIYLGEREMAFVRNTNDLSISLSVENVVDVLFRRVLELPWTGAWSDQIGSVSCKP